MNYNSKNNHFRFCTHKIGCEFSSVVITQAHTANETGDFPTARTCGRLALVANIVAYLIYIVFLIIFIVVYLKLKREEEEHDNYYN